jgi:hypothetical protein
MMELPTKEDLKRLSTARGAYCISIYLPTARKGVESLQGATRMKNLVREAERKLKGMGVDERAITRQIDSARTLAESYDFFQHQADGLAVFISPDGELTHYRIPIGFDEQVHVNGRFHLKPLMQVLALNGRFYVMALSRRAVRLFQATQFTISEIDLPAGIPRSLDEAMKYEDWSRGHHLSPGSQGRGAGGITEFSGHGVDASDQENTKEDLRQFLQMVNRGVLDLIGTHNVPMIAAGLEYLHPVYAEANTYPHFLRDAGVRRSVDDLRPGELHEIAWAAMQPHFEAALHAALDRFGSLRGKGLASSRVEEVVPAASDGRVESLLVSVDAECWGRFDEQAHTVEVLENDTPGQGEDLLDFSAVRTLLTGGAVYAVPRDLLPDNTPLAAVFRY